MDKLKKARAPVRTSLTRTLNVAEQELAMDTPNEDQLQLHLGKLDRVMEELTELDQKVLDALLDSDCTQAEYDQEKLTIEEYEDKYNAGKHKVNRRLNKLRPRSPVESTTTGTVSTSTGKRLVKLPKLELVKFNGQLLEWLGFWAQFKSIDDDETIAHADKFQYLVQAMEKGSRAEELVLSYPRTAENYPKAIAALKARFGKPELLVEVYVRELLKLVIANNSTNKEKLSVSRMYDLLESHLRALESLGLSMSTYAAILFPMVESSLPETVLVAWQRSPFANRESNDEDPSKARLASLMEFLRKEVEGEERVLLARAGFGAPPGKAARKAQGAEGPHDELPTAAGLFSGDSDTIVTP